MNCRRKVGGSENQVLDDTFLIIIQKKLGGVIQTVLTNRVASEEKVQITN